jgi:hypothetical protein
VFLEFITIFLYLYFQVLLHIEIHLLKHSQASFNFLSSFVLWVIDVAHNDFFLKRNVIVVWVYSYVLKLHWFVCCCIWCLYLWTYQQLFLAESSRDSPKFCWGTIYLFVWYLPRIYRWTFQLFGQRSRDWKYHSINLSCFWPFFNWTVAIVRFEFIWKRQLTTLHSLFLRELDL